MLSHGKIVDFSVYSDLIEHVPSRNDLLDRLAVDRVNGRIEQKESVMFLPNSVKEIHEKEAGELVFRLLMFGILRDGRKASVIVEDINPYLYVMCPNRAEVSAFQRKTTALINDTIKGGVRVQRVNGKLFDKWRKDNQIALKYTFDTLFDRKAVLKIADGNNLTTATNDFSHYERVVGRDHGFSFTTWNVLKNYTYRKADPSKLAKTFRVSHADINEYTGDVSAQPDLIRDKTLVETWDIEAYTEAGEMPKGDRHDDFVFAIGKTYHWKDSKDPLLRVGFVSRPCEPRPDKLTVVCPGQKQLIKAAFWMNKRLQPDFIVGFNDGDFDWTFILEKAVKLKCLPDIYHSLTLHNNFRDRGVMNRARIADILKWDCRKKEIKIEKGLDAYSQTLVAPGYINLDVRIALRKKYPKWPKSSLKYYLEQFGLGSKMDMPISRMFQITKTSLNLEIAKKHYADLGEDLPENLKAKDEQNKKDMADVLEYCVIDAQRCQELLVTDNIINDGREVCSMSRTTMYDALYIAGGAKVRNLVIHRGQSRGLLFNNQCGRRGGGGSYTGGHVFQPVKGLVAPKLNLDELRKEDNEWAKVPEADIAEMKRVIRAVGERLGRLPASMKEVADEIKFNEPELSTKLFRRFVKTKTKYPIGALDFKSLYPNIMMTYNLSPEMMIFDLETKEEALAEGHTLHYINALKTGCDADAWSVRHDTTDGASLQEGKSVAKFGLFPSILLDLYNDRTSLKKILKKVAAEKEHMAKEKSHIPGSPNYSKEAEDRYADVCFRYAYIDTKQKARKVFMNTFYGETGNAISPIYVMAIAACITYEGRRNLKLMAAVITRPGVDVKDHSEYKDGKLPEGGSLHYGDTDSNYFMCPPRHYGALDVKYYSGQMTKLEYSTALVEKTFVVVRDIQKIVNNALAEDNGTVFLRVDYEEVVFPAINLLKKMYAAVAHEKVVDFYPSVDDLFLRGLSAFKRSASGMNRVVCGWVLKGILDIHNTKSVKWHVEKALKDAYNFNWPIENFIHTGVLKPKVNNVAVINFDERMKARNDPMCPRPVPGNRFEYVVVYYPPKRKITGGLLPTKVSDAWEYRNYAEEKKLKIDLDHYMAKGVASQLAQFLTYHPMFHVEPESNSDADIDMACKGVVANANAYINQLRKAYSRQEIDQGPLLKVMYRAVRSKFRTSLVAKHGRHKADFILRDYSEVNDIYQHILSSVQKTSASKANAFGRAFVSNMRKKYGADSVYDILHVYGDKGDTLFVARQNALAATESRSHAKFLRNAERFREMFDAKDTIISDVIETLKVAIDHDFTTEHATLAKDTRVIKALDTVDPTKSFQDHMGVVNELYDIYVELANATEAMRRTEAIVEHAKYQADVRRDPGALPPGMSAAKERKLAVKAMLAQSMIDF